MIKFCLHRQKSEGVPDLLSHIDISISDDAVGNCVVPHPDPDVDLTAVLVGTVLNQAREKSVDLFTVFLDQRDVLPAVQMDLLTAMEDIVLVGYPSGLIDSVNRMPIFRQGVTATHPCFDYEGRREFLIDSAIFPGSSGSPVFWRQAPTYAGTDGIARVAVRPTIALIGILYAVHQVSSQGELEVVPAPTSERQVPIIDIPMNLGVCVNAVEISEMRDAVLDRAGPR
jgi:hypothetical protein